MEQAVYRKLKERYPLSVISFSPPETVFEKLFVTGEPDVVAEFYTRNKAEAPKAEAIRSVEQELGRKTGINPTGIAFENQLTENGFPGKQCDDAALLSAVFADQHCRG